VKEVLNGVTASRRCETVDETSGRKLALSRTIHTGYSVHDLPSM
jgi:hypothetical protein